EAELVAVGELEALAALAVLRDAVGRALILDEPALGLAHDERVLAADRAVAPHDVALVGAPERHSLAERERARPAGPREHGQASLRRSLSHAEPRRPSQRAPPPGGARTCARTRPRSDAP